MAKIAFTFTAGALAIGETLEILEKIDSEQCFMTFSDLESVLKRISNTSTMDNTSHITQILKDKLGRLDSRGEKKSNFTGSRGTVELKLMSELTRRPSNQSKKEEIINYYYQWPI
jgi:hypothetical protein